jgi:uncharacterized protein DUF1801
MTVDDWLAAHPDALPLANLVRGSASLDEEVKWGRLTFTADSNWHHWVCAVTDASLVFHKGVLLADPDGLLTGDGKYIRQVDAARALAAPDAVAVLVRDAIAHQVDMVD